MFSRLAWVGAQDIAIAERFKALGAASDCVTVTSSLKWDTADVSDEVAGSEALATAVGLKGLVWSCGSTGPGEEAMILEAYRSLVDRWPDGGAPSLAIVPRKPERFDEVARLIDRAGFGCVRRSDRRDGSPGSNSSEPTIVLGDTMGELRKFYALADVVFVGRSLVPMGGSDPMEVAALAKPMVVGPHMENFRGPVEAFVAVEGVRCIASGSELACAVHELLDDKAAAREMGLRARQVVIDHQGATEKTAERIAELLGQAAR